MTRKDFEQLRHIPGEIRALQISLANPKLKHINVFYKDYRTGKGIPKSRSEFGVDEQEINRLKRRLQLKIRRLEKLMHDAEDFLDEIEESETRTILRSYYINGQTQEEIGSALHYDRSTVGKKIDRFWQEHSHNSH